VTGGNESPKNGNGGSSGLTTIVAALTIVAILFGAGWTIFQAQLSDLRDVVKSDHESALRQADVLEAEIKTLHTELVGQAEFKQFVLQYNDLVDRLKFLEAEQRLNERTQAREPVEKATLEAINSAFDHRLAQIQSQMDDINKQIAAAIIIGKTK